MTAVFITATGTDIGKTFLTAGLIRHIRGAGGAVAAVKPIVSGFDPHAWQQSDPALLLTALGRPVALEEVERISPWRFKAPLSPHMAGKREGRVVVRPGREAWNSHHVDRIGKSRHRRDGLLERCGAAFALADDNGRDVEIAPRHDLKG